MRVLFFFLVLVNAGFFAWHSGYLGNRDTPKGEGERLTQQYQADKIRILAPDEAKKLADAAKQRTLACFEWGTFPTAEADKAGEALATLNLGTRLSTRKVEETAGWWVFMPSQGTKANADKKVDELKRLNVTDFFIVQDDGPNKFAISLGVFRTEDAAKNYLAGLGTKGVKTAQAAERETKVSKTIFRFTTLDDATNTKLEAIKKDFPGHDTRECAADDKPADEKKPDEKKADTKK
jgi:SPOR domain